MGLLLHLFVVTACCAVLHCAPVEEPKAESTTVGIQTLPALLPAKDDASKESDESKRVVREGPIVPPATTDDKKDSATDDNKKDSSTTEKPFQFGSRPVRDVSGAPKPPSAQTTPSPTNEKTQDRKVREAPPPPAAQPAPLPERNPPPPPPPGRGPPPPPPTPGDHPPPPPPAEYRPVRDTSRQGAPNVPQTRPATIPGRIEPRPVPGAAPRGRNTRETEGSKSSTENPEKKD